MNGGSLADMRQTDPGYINLLLVHEFTSFILRLTLKLAHSQLESLKKSSHLCVFVCECVLVCVRASVKVQR